MLRATLECINLDDAIYRAQSANHLKADVQLMREVASMDHKSIRSTRSEVRTPNESCLIGRWNFADQPLCVPVCDILNSSFWWAINTVVATSKWMWDNESPSAFKKPLFTSSAKCVSWSWEPSRNRFWKFNKLKKKFDDLKDFRSQTLLMSRTNHLTGSLAVNFTEWNQRKTILKCG